MWGVWALSGRWVGDAREKGEGRGVEGELGWMHGCMNRSMGFRRVWVGKGVDGVMDEQVQIRRFP